MKGRILSVSYDHSLLTKRRVSLERLGYEVISAEGFADAVSHRNERFDLIILGHTIPRDEKRIIAAEFVKSGSNARVLSLLRRGDPPIPEAARAGIAAFNF